MFASSQVELLELTLRVMADYPLQKTCNAVFFYGQTADNERSVIEQCAFLFDQGLVNNVAFSTGGSLTTGQPWAPDYQAKLTDLGVFKQNIIPVRITAPKAHTHTEAIAFVDYAKEQGWESVYVTGSPVHQLRVFVNTVSIVLQKGVKLKVLSAPGTPLPWTQTAIHSQNVERGKRFELVLNEFNRIEAYHAKGDLVSARQVLDYLNSRDQ